MWLDTDRDDDEFGDWDVPDDFREWRDPNAYWRRRFFILGGGIVALGVCAWLIPGVHPAASSPPAAAGASAAALATGTALPSAAYGPAWPGRSPASRAPSAAATPPGQPTPSASPAATATGKPGAGLAYHPSPDAGSPQCSPASIVLSLFTSRPSYGQHAEPKFGVYAVSTSAGTCTLSYGPGSVHVAVTSHGHVVWDSAACKPQAARLVQFTLGVPRVLTITWNRQARGPAGCAGSLAPGARGSFDAVAMTHGQSSPVRSFTIGQ